MKGMVFSEFLDFAETAVRPPVRFGDDVRFEAQQSYDYRRLLDLVAEVAERSAMTPGEVVRRFGTHLFGRFAGLYPVFFFGADSALEFLSHLDTAVHAEVQQLYPDAEFPRFDVERPGPDHLVLGYRSERPLADLAEGMLRGCVAHFGETIDIERVDDPASNGRRARFDLRRSVAPAS